jgi:outer membrane protein assembly factor BamA
MSKYLLGIAAVVAFAFGLSAQTAQKPKEDEKPPNVTIVSLAFENVTQISTADQESVASDVKSRIYHGPDWLEEVDERIRYAWQQRGYFGAKAHSDAHQRNSDIRDQEMEVTTSVDEGSKYLLKELLWDGSTTFTKDQLNAAMPIKRLDVFDAEKVRQGLENLRKLYASQGYINFACVPDTQLDDADHTVTLRLQLEPGEVFHVGAVDMTGGNAELRKKAQRAWPLHQGDLFNPDSISKFFREQSSMLPHYMSEAENVELKSNDKDRLMDITLHLERR